MSFWSRMNYVVWGLCGLIVFLISKDVIKIEKERSKSK